MINTMRIHPAAVLMLLLLGGCGNQQEQPLEGRPGGPFRLTLALDPAHPQPGEETELSFQLTYSKSGKPVTDLQVAHERLMHTFITDLDFTSFAHIHHEDFQPVTAQDREAGRLRFPYRFPRAGHYRIVSEFAHRNRSWEKHFDIEVGVAPNERTAAHDPARSRSVGAYTATLDVSPELPVAGFETEIVLRLEKSGAPVTDLELYLGSELHGAMWRDDGKFFGHLHSYTPRVAAIIELAHDRGVSLSERGSRIAEMMVQLMCLEAELVFRGPTIPMRYVFPEAGRYHVFLQTAPGGEPVVFQFALDVVSNAAARALASRGDGR